MIEKIIFGDNKPNTIYSDIAEQAAKSIQHGNKNNSSQLRKFYDEIVKWNNKVQNKKNEQSRQIEFKLSIPDIQKLKSQAAYAFSRDLIDDKYLEIFNHCIDSITSPRMLKEVKFFLEAMMGFYKYHEKLRELEQFQRNKQNKPFNNKQKFQQK